jgi:hypothetical protein
MENKTFLKEILLMFGMIFIGCAVMPKYIPPNQRTDVEIAYDLQKYSEYLFNQRYIDAEFYSEINKGLITPIIAGYRLDQTGISRSDYYELYNQCYTAVSEVKEENARKARQNIARVTGALGDTLSDRPSNNYEPPPMEKAPVWGDEQYQW